MGAGWPDTDLVFVWPDESPVHPHVLSRTYSRIPRRLHLPPMKLHNLRHAWAKAALRAGVDVKVVALRLGHFGFHLGPFALLTMVGLRGFEPPTS